MRASQANVCGRDTGRGLQRCTGFAMVRREGAGSALHGSAAEWTHRIRLCQVEAARCGRSKTETEDRKGTVGARKGLLA